jgi:ribonucleoside-triphosphate reductase
MTTTEISTRIAELEARAAQPGHHPTEIYTRIVGYYRSLANWNAGKREEYNHRVTFREDLAQQPHEKANKPTSWIAFVKDNCPQCPAMKSKLPLLPFEGTTVNVSSTEGFDAAVTHDVMATPTLLLLDGHGSEVLRITSALDWNRVEAAL